MISYRPLRDLLYVNKIKMARLIEAKVVTPAASVKLNNDRGYIDLSTVNKIGNYLSAALKANLAIEDMVRFIPDLKK